MKKFCTRELRLLVVDLSSKGPSSRFTSCAEQAPVERLTRRHAQKAVWMRGTWGETRKRQTTDPFGNFEDIFSEPVAPATGEADWLLGNCLRNFRGKHSRTRKNQQIS